MASLLNYYSPKQNKFYIVYKEGLPYELKRVNGMGHILVHVVTLKTKLKPIDYVRIVKRRLFRHIEFSIKFKF